MVIQAAEPQIGMSVETRFGSRPTIIPASRTAPASISAAQDGPEDLPFNRECNTSALTTANARNSGPAKNNHPDFPPSIAISVERMIPVPTTMLGPRSIQCLRVMTYLLCLISG